MARAAPEGAPIPAAARHTCASPRLGAARVLRPLGYELISPVAAGAFSTILRCRTIETGDDVAVKTFDGSKCAKDPTLPALRDNELEVLRLLVERAADVAKEAEGAGAAVKAGTA